MNTKHVALLLASFALASCKALTGSNDDAGTSGAPAGPESILFKMESVQGVQFNPPVPTIFTLTSASYLTRLMTYHYGATLGGTAQTIALLNTTTGKVLGPWAYKGYTTFPFAAGHPVPDSGYQPGPPDNYWLAFPATTIPPGTYQVIDSSPSTWSYTADQGNRGIAWVYGTGGGATTPGTPDAASTTTGRDSAIAPQPDAGRDLAIGTDARFDVATDVTRDSPVLGVDGGLDMTTVGTIPPWASSAPLPGDPPPPADTVTPAVKGSLQLGTQVTLAQGTIAAIGGSLVVAKPGDPLDGLTFTANAGALADGTAVTISSTPITSHSYGALVTAATPLITITDGGGMAANTLTVKLPVTIPSGTFALPVYYDPATGALEAIPLVTEDATSLTLTTRHFSSFFVTLIDPTLIPTVLDSGFRPGKDDWQFTNYGSYIASGGHCAGQSISAMWYYLTQRKAGGHSPLFGLYDDDGNTATPNLWQDDADGYRFASTVHVDINQKDVANTFFNDMRNTAPRLQWNAFRYAMALTGEPLAIGLWSADDKAGHEMLVYRINQSHLFVADPNYPAKWRTVDWNETNSTFNPYNSGTNAADIASGNDIAFTKFTCDGKTAMVDWNKIAKRWTEFEAGTIGQDRFPAASVMASEDGKTWKAADGFSSTQASVKLRFDPPSVANRYNSTYLQVFSGEQNVGAGINDACTVPLNNGDNSLGVALWANPYRETRDFQWVDFKHITIHRTAPDAATPDVGATAKVWLLCEGIGGTGETYGCIGWDGDTTFTGPGDECLLSGYATSNGQFTTRAACTAQCVTTASGASWRTCKTSS